MSNEKVKIYACDHADSGYDEYTPETLLAEIAPEYADDTRIDAVSFKEIMLSYGAYTMGSARILSDAHSNALKASLFEDLCKTANVMFNTVKIDNPNGKIPKYHLETLQNAKRIQGVLDAK